MDSVGGVLADYQIAVSQVWLFEVTSVEGLTFLFFAQGWPTEIYYEIARAFSVEGWTAVLFPEDLPAASEVV